MIVVSGSEAKAKKTTIDRNKIKMGMIDFFTLIPLCFYSIVYGFEGVILHVVFLILNTTQTRPAMISNKETNL